jgi:copper chaperone CopZ
MTETQVMNGRNSRKPLAAAGVDGARGTLVRPARVDVAVIGAGQVGLAIGYFEAAITAEVGGLSGVTAVAVDVHGKRVMVTGLALDDLAIREAIYDAGYEALWVIEQARPTGYLGGAGSTRRGS